MKRELTAERLETDRKHLLSALQDYRSGRYGHLPIAEQRDAIESIERRITYLDEKIGSGCP